MSEALRAAVAHAEELERLAFASTAPNIVVALRQRDTISARLALTAVELRNELRRVKADNDRLRNTVEDLRLAIRLRGAA